ncbi:MAG: hypothetical protein A2887_04650 [Alphaproteobacteria bacterium RIFCSPLOWO2_01_FULL_40_26]|nr:MAG: hypothetical protein A3D15_04515 [Alphaproteobacteria bacterium RIFCSPHIGHO2_02_FULL_40_34]OFW94352.1 MAG: hypothetical protein A2887_04650 [Alphaproteobacteria bacterium RIFCSPLOWO2_01_FULL_40_26]OFX09500.1 MAG: hypothetical protein A3H30_02305 [Alphaproteobacteria bacterium RIFCSPLOWO2_02_FULL_40_19]OFX11131.1 MAG: hypothetical protein A3G22_02865 [Alphaproteobacteria bacterium RIFCSPLOWO2_12_FULL_40_11]
MQNKAPNLQVEIISPEGVLFNDICHLAVVPSALGDIGFMSGHEIVVATLRAGQISIYDDGQNLVKSFDVASGFVKMQTLEKLVVLVD